MPSPHDMPKRMPKHIWTPPADKSAPLPSMPYLVELASSKRNAKSRRIHRRNGTAWARQIDDVN